MSIPPSVELIIDISEPILDDSFYVTLADKFLSKFLKFSFTSEKTCRIIGVLLERCILEENLAKLCQRGGIGRRSGFKIHRLQGYPGSIPGAGTPLSSDLFIFYQDALSTRKLTAKGKSQTICKFSAPVRLPIEASQGIKM